MRVDAAQALGVRLSVGGSGMWVMGICVCVHICTRAHPIVNVYVPLCSVRMYACDCVCAVRAVVCERVRVSRGVRGQRPPEKPEAVRVEVEAVFRAHRE